MSRGRSVVPAGVLVGLAAALLLTLLQDSTYRAEGTLVLTREGRAPGDDPTLAPAAEAAAELLESRAVAESVRANLRLDDSAEELLERVDLDVSAQSSLLRLAVEAGEPEEARRTAQELAEVFTVLYNMRFGPATTTSVWEAPRARAEAVSPELARNLVLGALAGALAGLALVHRPRREARPERRPEPAQPQPPRPEPAAAPPAPAAPSSGPFAHPERGEWTVADVERLLAEHGDAFPERRAELELYLESFRQVAAPDGRLPGTVEDIVEEEFAALIARASGTLPA